MLQRRALDDLFAALPAILVTRAGLTADEATAASDNALLVEDVNQADTLMVYVSVANDTGLTSYRLNYNSSSNEYQLRHIQTNTTQTFERAARWQYVE